MNRRRFLHSLLLGAAGVAAPGIWSSAASGAACMRDNRALVVVFLRGGCDGLNVVVPHGEEAYHRNRPRIRIPAPHAGDTGAALDLDGFFGLHPALRPLHAMYQLGRVALLPAVHYPKASRSHFESQDTIEFAASSKNVSDGWLNRYLVSAGTGGAAALAITAGLPPAALRGKVHVPVYPDPSGLWLSRADVEKQLLKDVLSSAYRGPHSDRFPGAAQWSKPAQALLRDLAAWEEIQASTASNAAYPDGNFGHALGQTAALLKADARLGVVALDLGGWDTHSAQGGVTGRQASLLDTLARGLAAFDQDLGPRRGQVCVLVMTEFGRTVADNGSGGTDHGHASAWMVIGGGVRGGIYNGTTGWPGLETHQLLDGRYLKHNVDFRDVYAEILSHHLACSSIAQILPGHPYQPLGLFY